jgi:hypothetical protein
LSCSKKNQEGKLMAKVIPVGQPVNDAERSAIAYLRDRLPDSFVLLHNFEIERQGERFEIDIALLTPHALYLIDVKGTRGTIDVYGNKWYPEGRAPYPSPLGKLRGHARTVKGLVTQANPVGMSWTVSMSMPPSCSPRPMLT